MRRWTSVGSLAGWMLWIAAAGADHVEWIGRPPLDVRFMGYEEGVFLFQDSQRQTQRLPVETVKRLHLSEVLPVALELQAGRRDLEVDLYGYEEHRFVLRVDGRLLRIPRSMVAGLTLGLRSERMRALAEVAVLLDAGDGQALTDGLQPEQPAIVLFHHPGRPHSVRLDGYLGRFPVMSRGGIGYYKVEMERQRTPLAERYRVSTFPTILFFDAHGKESARLEGAVTTREVDGAVRRIVP